MKYKKIMTLLTSPKTVVQMCFLESSMPVFDQLLLIFQAEGPVIHVLHQAMLHLLKQVMFRFLKQNEIQGKTVSEVLKLDSKKVEHQLKDDELEIGTKTRKAINDIKHIGKQKQCYLGLSSFFTGVTTYIQKSLALRNLLIEALACLHPDQKTGIRSSQKLRVVESSLPCVKPEELTLLTDEWRVYAKTDIP